MRRVFLCAMAMTAAGWALAGCQDPTIALRRELIETQDQLAKCQGQDAQLQEQLRRQEEQLAILEGLGDKRLSVIPHVERIAIGEYTTGIAADGGGGERGVKALLETVDQSGTTIKAAGEVTVQLYDLAAPHAQNLIAQCTWPADKASEHWTNGFLTQYFVYECFWKTAPKHDEITVRVEFVDYLTGRKFSAQKAIKIKLPPATRPATGTATAPARMPQTLPAKPAQ